MSDKMDEEPRKENLLEVAKGEASDIMEAERSEGVALGFWMMAGRPLSSFMIVYLIVL
jgi:hypothetical protein